MNNNSTAQLDFQIFIINSLNKEWMEENYDQIFHKQKRKRNDSSYVSSEYFHEENCINI